MIISYFMSEIYIYSKFYYNLIIYYRYAVIYIKKNIEVNILFVLLI